MESMEWPIYRFKFFPQADYLKDLITAGTLKFSYPFKDFNDPFDCSPHIYLGSFEKFKKETKKRKLNINNKVLKANFFKARSQILRGEFYQAAPRFGVCCLTRDPFNLLMWAHYASDHKGILVVFRFDGPMLVNREKVFPMRVSYSDERPSLSLWAAAEEVEKWNLTKGRCWEYEQEERMFVMTQPDGVYEIDRKAHLEAIVLGARAPASFESDIESYVQRCRADLGIKLPLFKAQVSRTKYELEIPGFTYEAEP